MMKKLLISLFAALLCSYFPAGLAAAPPDDLTVSKKVTVNGVEFVTQSLLKGQRERSTMQMNGTMINTSIRQCDLHRTLTVQDSTKAFMIRPDVEESPSAKEAKSKAAEGTQTGGTLLYTSTVKDTGERKQILGYNAKHLKLTIVGEPGANSCQTTKQKYDIDGWYIDLKTVPGACQSFSPAPSRDTQGCQDKIFFKQSGTVKPGYAVQETMTIQNDQDAPMTISTEVTDIQKGPLAPELFDVPSDYRQVSSVAELKGVPANFAQSGAQTQQPSGYPQQNMPTTAQMMNPVTGPAAQMAMQQKMMAQAAAMGMSPGGQGMPNMSGMGGMGGNQPASQAIAAPQALGPKAAGRIRIGVVTPQAQMGQGTNAGQDFGTPIRNAMIQLMSGPAVEIAALDSHIPIQIQAEAQQKQCDYVLYANVTVKHGSKGGFGNFMKMAAPIASMAPMAGGMGGAMAGAAASQMASAAAQQAAMSQLGQFNGQIKSKDDVTVQYQLMAPGQEQPKTQNTLQAKAKSDGEDVMTPLLTQIATTVLTEALKK